MHVQVRLPAILREFAAGAAVLHVELAADRPTAERLFDELAMRYPALERRIRDERGELRRHVNVFVGQTNLRDTAGLATVLPPQAEIHVIPAVSGG